MTPHEILGYQHVVAYLLACAADTMGVSPEHVNALTSRDRIVQSGQADIGPEAVGTIALPGALVGVFQLGGGPAANPSMITLTCGVDVVPPLGGPYSDRDNSRLVGNLKWGTGGVLQEVDFDWSQGTRISLTASHLSLGVRYQTIDGLAIPPGELFRTYRVKANAAFEPHGGLGPVFSARPVTILPAASADFALPRFTARAEWYGDASPASLDVTWVGQGAAAGTITETIAPRVAVPPPNGAVVMRITNTTAGNVFVAPIFTLYL